MSFDKVVVSHEEVERIKLAADAPAAIASLPSPIPLIARLTLPILVLFLPLLCLVTLILRVAFRGQTVRVRYAWVSFLSTLLLVSSVLTTIAVVLTFSFAPAPALATRGLGEFDDRSAFPTLPSAAGLTSGDVSVQLKPLVVVLSPAVRLWNRQEVASPSFGAGVLIESNKDGYLFVTANHVVHGAGAGFGRQALHAMIAASDNVWSSADVVAVAPPLDLALVWVPREAGHADFVQPLAEVRDGESIYVIGHPEGFRYTLSTGIVSGVRGRSVQISAAVSPGNSGGPVYDDRGNLLAIVSSKFDRSNDPNGENLGFAVAATALLDPSAWTFAGKGALLLAAYMQAEKASAAQITTH